MKTSIATFFAAHKTSIIIASAALVIGAKAMSFATQNNQYEMDGEQQMMMMQQQQMQQQGGGQMQMPQGYNRKMQQQNGNGQQGFFDSWFGGNENEVAQGVNYDGGYNTGGGYANQSGGYSGGYTPTSNNNYGTGAYSASNYNTNSSLESTSAWQAGQNSQDGSHERFVDAMREETKYNDADGNSYKLSSGYDYNYVNPSTNEAVQTNDASVTPSAYSSYTSVSASDYSSSSSSSSSTGE